MDGQIKKTHVNIVFIGHVDAGKSSLAGNTLLLTGQVDQRTIEKYEREAKAKKRESWFLAFILDTNEEERAKGKTVEVGRAYFSTNKRRFTILDAPGHKNYIPNMIGGAAQADVGILVISARKGEFETGFKGGGQTQEHAVLAKTLGVDRLIVVVNKMDEKTVLWSQNRYDFIIKQLCPFLKEVGFNLKTRVTFLPISGLTGANIKDRVSDDICSWYNGPSMLEVLDHIKLPRRKSDAPLRIPILDKYKHAGKVFIEGKVESGTVHLGDNVIIMPNNTKGKIILLGTDTVEMNECGPGENIRIVISGVTLNDLHPGFVICHEKDSIKPATLIEAQVYTMDLLPHKPIMTAGYRSMLHCHTATMECVVSYISTGKGKKGTGPSKSIIQSKTMATMRIKFDRRLCVETYDTIAQLGRFTLRDEGKTIAIGKITRKK